VQSEVTIPLLIPLFPSFPLVDPRTVFRLNSRLLVAWLILFTLLITSLLVVLI
jgi:hypothetical protein